MVNFPSFQHIVFQHILFQLPRKHFDRSNNFVLSSCEEMLFRLPGDVFCCDVNFVKCKQNVIPLSRKVVFIWDKNFVGHRDLACQLGSEISVPGKTFCLI